MYCNSKAVTIYTKNADNKEYRVQTAMHTRLKRECENKCKEK